MASEQQQVMQKRAHKAAVHSISLSSHYCRTTLELVVFTRYQSASKNIFLCFPDLFDFEYTLKRAHNLLQGQFCYSVAALVFFYIESSEYFYHWSEPFSLRFRT